MNKKERKALRRGIGKYTWALLLYYLIFNAAVFVVMELNILYEGFMAVIDSGNWSSLETGMLNALEKVIYENGWGYLIACVIAVLAIRGWKGKTFFRDMYHPKQDMTGKSFWSLLCLMMAGQMIFQILAIIAETILNLFGLSILEAMEASTLGVDTFSMFLYMGIAAPIVEEIVFRGLILRGLEPYGKRFAIFASALLFGAFHANPIQSPFAFVVGLVLGYTAMEHSIWWAMVLHMINNLVLGDMIVRLTSGWPFGLGNLLLWLLIMAGTVAAIVILVVKRGEVSIYHHADPMDRWHVKAFFTALPNIIFFLLMALNAVMLLFA